MNCSQMHALALIDGDIVTYRCGAAADGRHYVVKLNGVEQAKFKYKKEADFYVKSNLESIASYPDTLDIKYEVEFRKEPEPLENALHSVKVMIYSMLDEAKAHSSKIFLSPPNNSSFRYKLYPEYKANRKGMEKPHWYDEIREYLIRRMGAKICEGIEADDALGIYQTDDSIICSTDKDLKMIPGWHYNFVTKEKVLVSDVDGWFNFHQQLLTGDMTDNVKGIYGLGPAKAAAILDCDPNEYTNVVFKEYQKAFDSDARTRLELIAKLLWIQRAHGQDIRLEDKEIDGSISYSWRTVVAA